MVSSYPNPEAMTVEGASWESWNTSHEGGPLPLPEPDGSASGGGGWRFRRTRWPFCPSEVFVGMLWETRLGQIMEATE